MITANMTEPAQLPEILYRFTKQNSMSTNSSYN
jgi:hypothetical protein